MIVPQLLVKDRLWGGDDLLVNEEMDDSLERAVTTATGLEAKEQTRSENVSKLSNDPLLTDEDMFGVNDLDGDEVIVESVDVVKTAEETRSVVEEVTAVIIPVISSQQPSQVKVQEKGKGKMVEPEPVKKMSKKELLRLDEELAFKLQAREEEEEERLAREKA
ncbi:hypothetical protein Tco_0099150 [Tanacetum coccineum]